jgi:hypothetical protein
MAVSALPRFRAHVRRRPATVPLVVLAVTLVAPAIDLVTVVQPTVQLPGVALAATAIAALGLLVSWVLFPLSSWLAAATVAAGASVVMRLLGAEYAPALNLLALVALGLGGAFASPSGQPDDARVHSADALSLEEEPGSQPSVARR